MKHILGNWRENGVNFSSPRQKSRVIRIVQSVVVVTGTLFIAACGGGDAPVAPTEADAGSNALVDAARSRFGGSQVAIPTDRLVTDAGSNATRQALFGDLHTHTTYSFDAFAFGTIATPYDAYRHAKGETLKHPGGFDMKLKRPLDFYAVTDHAMFLGVLKEAADTTTDFSRHGYVESVHNMNAPANITYESVPLRTETFGGFLQESVQQLLIGKIDIEEIHGISRSAWQDIVNAAEVHNEPGKFTTFVAYEYTSSTDERGNLHRNVIFADSDRLPAVPYSRFHSQDPEGLWDWMDGLRAEGIEAMAIPHNSNGSNGAMFKLVDWAGDPMDENYTAKRLRNEPLIELTQVKGTSETHPMLSPNDEWANFEIMPYRVATTMYSEPKGSYAREALLNGLDFMAKGQTNPYKFGFVAASDTHTAATSVDEDDFSMKVGLLDGTAQRRGSVPLTGLALTIAEDVMNQEVDETAAVGAAYKRVDGEVFVDGALTTFGASGLAGVWAEENSRSAIYAAFRRKETFATSGTRIRIRMFAGFDFDESLLEATDSVEQGYARGVPMGADLHAKENAAPILFAWAVQDALSAPLQRLQVIKGWTSEGNHNEVVYDVACSDDATPDPETNRCPDNGATVNLNDCAISDGSGAAELKAVWQDPDYDADDHAFYYVRVLENPTCRWSTWDAIRAGTKPRSDFPTTIQERAWSSPVWVIPKG